MQGLKGHLSVRGVVRGFEAAGGDGGGRVVLDGVDLEVSAGERWRSWGLPGRARARCCNIVGTLDKPTAGTVVVDAVQVTGLSADDAAGYRAKKVGFVFQDHHLLPQLTGVENVILPARGGRGEGTGGGGGGRSCWRGSVGAEGACGGVSGADVGRGAAAGGGGAGADELAGAFVLR